MIVQLYVHVVLWIRVSILYWIAIYVLGDKEPAPKELLKLSDKVPQKSVMDLPHRPLRAHYVVGGGVQDVHGRVVVHHEKFVTCRRKL